MEDICFGRRLPNVLLLGGVDRYEYLIGPGNAAIVKSEQCCSLLLPTSPTSPFHKPNSSAGPATASGQKNKAKEMAY